MMFMLHCQDLTCEYLSNPLCIDKKKPRFSWKLKSDKINVIQTAYEIIVDGMWNSGIVMSDRSLHVEYGGKELQPLTEYNWRVRVWDNFNNVSDFAESCFETGFLCDNGFTADFITAEKEEYPVFRKEFDVTGEVERARIFASGYAVYDMTLNGKRVGDAYFAPGATSYKYRLQYQCYDITDMLAEGRNAVRIDTGVCWFKWCDAPKRAVIAQIHIFYKSGEKAVIKTSDDWKTSGGGIQFSHLYDGEIYDFTKEKKGASLPGYDDSLWENAVVASYRKDNITAQVNEPVVIKERIKPKAVFKTPKGETVIDFGQNMAGCVKFKAKGNKGDRVSISHAEILDSDGNFYTENLRSAKQNITCILYGDKIEEYHSRFTYQGFRFVRIDEYPGEIRGENFEALVMYSDLEETGTFECSLPEVNRLFLNVVWAQRSNFIDIPTDCPQRDERFGWTGDAQIFMETAARNMNVAAFFTKWLADLALEQTDEGVPRMVPDAIGNGIISAGWGDAATICPWQLYRAYGDERILETQYGSMKSWVEYIRGQGDNEYLWNTGRHYGDWLSLDSKAGDFFGGTDIYYIATAYYARSCYILAKAAEMLDKKEDAEEYLALYGKIVSEFQKTYMNADGTLKVTTQTAYALAIQFDLVDNKEKYAGILNEMIKENGTKISTGFLGTPCICSALSENGYLETAYDLFLRHGYPSWLYEVKLGATTIWEHWDGINEKGEIKPPGMNSFNHYCYGTVANWMYGAVAGINIGEPGYKHIIIKPCPDRRIKWVKASIDTMYGKVISQWEETEEGIIFKIGVPHNTKATFISPDGAQRNFGSGKYTIKMLKTAQMYNGKHTSKNHERRIVL